MANELTIRGVYYKREFGKWTESHGGTPGIELTLGDERVFLDHRDVALIAKSIERLGTSGRNSITVRTVDAYSDPE